MHVHGGLLPSNRGPLRSELFAIYYTTHNSNKREKAIISWLQVTTSSSKVLGTKTSKKTETNEQRERRLQRHWEAERQRRQQRKQTLTPEEKEKAQLQQPERAEHRARRLQIPNDADVQRRKHETDYPCHRAPAQTSKFKMLVSFNSRRRILWTWSGWTYCRSKKASGSKCW